MSSSFSTQTMAMFSALSVHTVRTLTAAPFSLSLVCYISTPQFSLLMTLVVYILPLLPMRLIRSGLNFHIIYVWYSSITFCFQWLEVPFDSQMNRTKTRPLVTGELRYYILLQFSHANPSLSHCTDVLILQYQTSNQIPKKKAHFKRLFLHQLVGF